MQMQNQLCEQNTSSCHARVPWAAARDAARRNQANRARLTNEQVDLVNKLYKLVCLTYNCRVFKNIRATCVTIKAEHIHSRVNIKAVDQLHAYCHNNGIRIRVNVNTESISYVLMF